MLMPTLAAVVLATSSLPTNTPAVTAPLPVRSLATAHRTLETEPDYLARAIAAQAAGDLETARREYVVAAALERDAGRVPTQASYGLALVLSELGRPRDGARVLEDLAIDASARHDFDAEARALLDALYLNSRAQQPWRARTNLERLTALARGTSLSPALRKRIADV